MKKTLFIICLLAALSVIPMNGTLAQEETADNWCYPGGPWADGRCQTDWHWNCGWYMAHYESGDVSRAQVEKTECRSLLPPASKTIRCLVSGEHRPIVFEIPQTVLNGSNSGPFIWTYHPTYGYGFWADEDGDGITVGYPDDFIYSATWGFDNQHDCSR